VTSAPERIGLVLTCQGMGDCLFALSVIRKLQLDYKGRQTFDLFTHHPGLFGACPYVENVYPIGDKAQRDKYPHQALVMFEPAKLPHPAMDTFDFISIPLGIGTLSFREKQLEYFPAEADHAEVFDVVLNTSITWPVRSWPLESWQRLADALKARGMSVAVVGKDTYSAPDAMLKRSPPLAGCRNFANQLSLDQTFFTIRNARLFVSCQNGLSVLAGATDVEIVVLDFSIDWSKRAIYRNQDPRYKATYVKGGCDVYCAVSDLCPLPENRGELKCIPGYEKVEAAVFRKLGIR
jgi:ADP-heptose:LPS heptosyltransferase